MPSQLSEQEIVRRNSLEELRQMGIDPFPAELFPVNSSALEIKEKFQAKPDERFSVCLAGRLMSKRVMGKASFAELKDSSGRIQIYVVRDEICPGEDKDIYNKVFKKLLDIGDFIGVKGYVFKTQMGEISVHVQELVLLCKSLRPLPVVKVDADGKVHDAFVDPELRHRMRYVDLIVNEEVRTTFLQRTKMINSIREYLNARGALEVETPVLQSIPGGAAARPFITHHNALDIPLYLRIANELYLKRLIVGGFDWVYEFSRDFRNEGMDRSHNPEFTILEFYVAFKDYFWMMETTEELLEKAAIDLHGTTEVLVQDQLINFRAPFRRIALYDAIKEYAGEDLSQMNEVELRAACKRLGVPTDDFMGKGRLIDEIFSAKCEKHFVQPTFIIDYPVEMSPLTKMHRSKPGLVERFELMINGKEIANAYSELNDPIEQRQRFEQQMQLMERGDHEAMYIDEDFLRALEFGMPPCSGIGIGIDRLVMLLTNQSTIQEVLFFPQMRPERPERDKSSEGLKKETE
jgi:lysyl-tRNA synthetase, class II